MPTMIRDGRGRGYLATVNSHNRMLIESTIDRRAHYVNHHDKRYFTITINQQATAINNCIGYMKNDDDLDLVIDTVYLYSSFATLIEIKLRDNGTPGGTLTNLIPVNCNAGSALTADCTAHQSGEITGLDGGSSVLYWYAPANDPRLLDFHPSFILPKNQVIMFYSNQATAATIIGLGFCFYTLED